MRLTAMRFAESVGACGAPQRDARRDTAPLAFACPVHRVLPARGGKVTENRLYTPAPPRSVDDTDYLAGVEAHKRAFAKDLENAMVPAGRLPGYFEVPTDEGWRITLELAEGRLELADAWGMNSEREVAGDLAPFAWAYRNCDFCIVTIYDKDIGALRDDLLFVAKRAGVDLVAQECSLRDSKRPGQTAPGGPRRSRIEIGPSGIICASGAFTGFTESFIREVESHVH